jgi:hypothetical protein
MTMFRLTGACIAAVAILAACGGQPPPPPAPPAPPPTPAASASASAEAPAQPPQELYDVDIVPTRISPAPKTMPKVSIDVPGNEQFVPATFLAKKDYKVRPNVRGWEGLPEGSYLQLILDNKPAAPVKDPKAPVLLSDLAPDGNLEQGEHVMAAFMCGPNHESIKGTGAVSVNRFWAIKNTGKEYKSSAPMLILSRPHGTYAGAEADDILIDWYVLNAVLGEKDNYVRITLKGPGIKEELSRNINEWRPYSIVSPHKGEYTITADLMDKNGNPVPGIWNSTTRTFNVDK